MTRLLGNDVVHAASCSMGRAVHTASDAADLLISNVKVLVRLRAVRRVAVSSLAY